MVVFVSQNIVVILLHVLAFILALGAAYTTRASVDGSRRFRVWHLGWLSVAVLVFMNFLADLGALK